MDHQKRAVQKYLKVENFHSIEDAHLEALRCLEVDEDADSVKVENGDDFFIVTREQLGEANKPS